MSAECSAGNIPPGYKQTEVGVIPEDWDVCLLDSVANRGSGHTPDKSHPEYWGGNIKWISLQDSDRLDKLYIYDTAAKITPLGIKNSSAKMHLEGTVVLSRDAGVGKSAIMKEDMAVSQHFIAWKCGPLLNNHFLYYWLQSNKSEFERIAMGNTIKTIGLPYFRRLSIPLPTIGEQEAIAEALSDTDALIESFEQLIAKKRQIKQGAMQELLTGKKRLPGFATKAGYKHIEIGAVPEDWEVKSLGSFCEIVAGRDLVRTDFSPTDDYNHQFPIYSNSLTNKGLYGYSKSYQYEPDKITVTARGDIGHAFYRDVKFSAIGRLLVLSSQQQCDLRFVTEYINSFVNFALESTGVPQLTAPQITKYVIVLPSTRAEQTAIANILSDMDSEITTLEEKLAKARQIKQGMMQELLTGKIRLI